MSAEKQFDAATIQALAEYFSSPQVVVNSIRLQSNVPGPARASAKAFFELRDVLGVRGYAKKDEAARNIVAALLPK